MVDFPDGTPSLPDIEELAPPGSAAGIGIRALVNRANDNILSLIDRQYNDPSNDFNIAMNGGPLIWPFGTSFPAIADSTEFAKNWIYNKSGSIVHTVNRSTDVPTISQNVAKGVYSVELDVTTAEDAIIAGDMCTCTIKIPGYLFNHIAQREFTVRFTVEAAKTGVHCVAFRNSGLDRYYIAEITIANANTPEEHSITVPASPVDGTWNYDTGAGLYVSWVQLAGTDYQAAAGAWATGNKIATANQVNEGDSTANVFKVYGVSIRPGPFARAYSDNPLQLEKLLTDQLSGNDLLAGSVLKTIEEITGLATVYNFDNIPQTYKTLLLVLYGRLSAAVLNSQIYIRFNGDVAVANYSSIQMYGNSSTAAAISTETGSLSAGHIGYLPGNSSSNYAAPIVIIIPRYSESTYKKVAKAFGGFKQSTAAGNMWTTDMTVFWEGAAAINQIEISSFGTGGGDLMAGSSAVLYGLPIAL